MKKVILVCSAVCFISMGSFAQSNLPRKSSKDTVRIENTVKTYPDGVMMTEGEMKLVKNNVVTPMEVDITMSDGTKVLVDGTIVTKDKIQTKMKEGQHMNMNGVITEMKDLK